VAWLPSLDLNRPLQAFRSPGSIRPMPKRSRSLCTTPSQVCLGLPFPLPPSILSFLTLLIQPELRSTWPSHLSLPLRSTVSISVIHSFSRRLSHIIKLERFILCFNWNFVETLLQSFSLVLIHNLKSLFTLSSRIAVRCRHQFKRFVLYKELIQWPPNDKNEILETILYTH
jgi:hypothetical protein